MSLVRIKAVYVENNVEQEDHLVFDAFVRRDRSFKRMEMFGYIVDDDEKWPIVIKDEREHTRLDWGAVDSETRSVVNIFEKKAERGEYFTRTDRIEDEEYSYTYRIVEISSWDDLP